MVEYRKKNKNKGKTHVVVQSVVSKSELKQPLVIPYDIVGKQVRHKSFGTGFITTIKGIFIEVEFDKVELKKIVYEFCINSKLLEFI